MSSSSTVPSRPGTPPSTPGFGLARNYFDKLEVFGSDTGGAFTLFDTFETYFDSHLDLWQRNLEKTSNRLKVRAQETFKRQKSSTEITREQLTKNLEKEVKEFRIKVSKRLTNLTTTWQSAKVVRTRDKISFFFGVMSLLVTALLIGMKPEWIHLSYTLQSMYYLPLRAYRYKKRAWHYFLFDLCYYVTALNFLYLWAFPHSPALFVACYTLSHGSLASAVITWRNSLVFHDVDKVTSLFVHIYPPLVFTTIRHYYPQPDVLSRFPALIELPHLNPARALLLSGAIYVSWQTLYWKFLLVDRKTKIRSGERATSFSFLLKARRGWIGYLLNVTPEIWREPGFMFGQLVYSVLTELPCVYIFYDSKLWSSVYLLILFMVSVWNGGGFYIEVFGRKFEKELEALRKELAAAGVEPLAAVSSSNSLDSTGTTPRNEKRVSGSDFGGSPPLTMGIDRKLTADISPMMLPTIPDNSAVMASGEVEPENLELPQAALDSAESKKDV